MLKLQYRGTAKSIWLVGPVMKVGSARNSDVIVQGEGVEPLHCQLHVSDQEMVLEPLAGNAVFLNEKPVREKVRFSAGDVIRIAAQELGVIDPRDQTNSLPSRNRDAIESSEETVFRNPAASESLPQASGWMLQGMHKTLKNKRYPIDGVLVLGRSSECGLHFSYDRLSRKHAELKLIDGVLFVRDLDSSNGTYHNGEKVKQARLHPGDTVAFDKLEFTVIGPGSVDDTLPPADNLNQTVVRSAITPEMIRQASKKPSAAAPAVSAAGKPAQDRVAMSGVILVAAALVVVGLVAVVLLV